MSTISDRVLALIAKASDEDPEKIKSNANWKELGFDSLQTVELIMSLEDEFGVEVADDDAEKLQCFGDVVAYIESKQ